MDAVKPLLTDDRMREVWAALDSDVAREGFFHAAVFAFQGYPTGERARWHGALDRRALELARQLLALLSDIGGAHGLTAYERTGRGVSIAKKAVQRFEEDLAAQVGRYSAGYPDPLERPAKKRHRGKKNSRIFFVEYMTRWARARLDGPARTLVSIATNVMFNVSMDEGAVSKIAP